MAARAELDLLTDPKTQLTIAQDIYVSNIVVFGLASRPNGWALISPPTGYFHDPAGGDIRVPASSAADSSFGSST
ncbi:MAG: hypothetical protein R2762_20880 [Bryobacteraceae bacterium]